VDEIRVLVVDDHPLFREGVVRTLNEETDMTVVAEADTAAGAIETARGTLPDVVLLDLKLPDASGLTVVETLQHECPYSHIVVLTAVEDEDALLQALKQGARGYLVKGISGHELKNVVRAIARGETYVSPSMAGRLLKELTTTEERSATMGVASLTDRERSILQLVAEGMTNKEIARRLSLSEKTVKHYMTNILQKLQVRNRVEAALLASRNRPAY